MTEQEKWEKVINGLEDFIHHIAALQKPGGNAVGRLERSDQLKTQHIDVPLDSLFQIVDTKANVIHFSVFDHWANLL